jgi:hypothetical protein
MVKKIMDVYLLKFEKELVSKYEAVYRQYQFKFGNIVLNDFAVEAISQEGKKLYPTSMVCGLMWLEARLRSTISGLSARWITRLDREKLSSVLNGAKYEPMFRGFITKFIWYPPSDAISRRDGMNLEEYISEYVGVKGKVLDDEEVTEYLNRADYDVAQLGSGVINWVAKLAEPREMPQPEIVEVSTPRRGYLRDLMRNLIPGLAQGETEKIFQGHLTLLKVNGDYDMEQFGNLLYPVRRTIYNHYFSTGGVIAQRNTEYLVYMDEDGYVLSPGHEPVELTGGLYIASHPVPVKQRKAD